MSTAKSKGWAWNLWGWVSLALILLPAIFFFFAVQHSALTVPYWDHCEMIATFAKYYDGTLTLSDLWAPHNHTRPLLYRAALLFTGIQTDWDIRLEYCYLIGSFYIAFVILGATLWRVMGRVWSWPFLMALGVLSILCFSPVSHNNHWWSMMIQLDFANVLILAALTWVAFRPTSWVSSFWACLFCWGATYTLTNGLFAFAALIVVMQLTGKNPFRIQPKTLFWLANLIVCLILYLPGLPESPATLARPTLLAATKFVLAYLGSPLVFLLHFPFGDIFEGAPTVRYSAPVGLLLLIAVVWVAAKYRHTRLSLARPLSPGALLWISMTVFTLSSAAATALGRAAFDASGPAAGNASRYTLFSVYLIYGFIFFFAEGLAVGSLRFSLRGRRFGVLAYALFIALGVRTYYRSIPLYHSAYLFNHKLEIAWRSDATSEYDTLIYPNPVAFRQMKAEMKRLKIGPFRERTDEKSLYCLL